MDTAAPAHSPAPFRIVTYNVHRCVGTDGKLSPQRVAEVIAACEPDIVALQEVDVGRVRTGGIDQVAAIAGQLGMQPHFHPAIHMMGELYGDAILTRAPSSLVKAALLPSPRLRHVIEPRGALWVETEFGGLKLDIVNTHLGLTRAERSMQVGALIGPDWIGGRAGEGAFILAGDFNVGRRSRSFRRLSACLKPARDATGRRRLRTFPSRLPMLALDHMFVSDAVETIDMRTVRTKLTQLASDHLPLVAEFRMRAA
ncbi:MAG TPA: endonuclease/exonuclease/phosphatase family protein [Alphaproteobacteria bacterium]|jgi:endonuclease/exonuclease/phosphatase family metal-dependent hydrolase|nr:endonuclease/exonuclease/phosphatase family protein [Alphaproteobacteria bacterium]